jgi:hypothetical protein
MGWTLTREENKVVNEKDEGKCKLVSRQSGPMISTFIRAQWESKEMENVDDERQQLLEEVLEEVMELDHIWGVWEEEKELIDVHRKWIRQPSQSGNDMRHHVKVHASHREQEWESPSASLIEQDPEVVPDVDIAAQGKDFFLDVKIQRHELGPGYVRVVEQSIMWREMETFKVFTYQGLTTSISNYSKESIDLWLQ